MAGGRISRPASDCAHRRSDIRAPQSSDLRAGALSQLSTTAKVSRSRRSSLVLLDEQFGALDAQTRVSCDQHVAAYAPPSLSLKWSVRSPNKKYYSRRRFKTSLLITKASMFGNSMIFSRSGSCGWRYSIPSIFERRNIKHQPESSGSGTTARSRARTEYLAHRELSNNLR